MSIQAAKQVYKIIYYNQEEVYEIYAARIYQSDMYGFIEAEELLFGERSQLLVDPGEEKLKSEFAGVKRTFIPMTAIVRIDEVEQTGQPKIKAAGSGKSASVTSFPKPVKPD